MEKIKELKHINNELVSDLQAEIGAKASFWARLEIDDGALGNFSFMDLNIFWFTKSLC